MAQTKTKPRKRATKKAPPTDVLIAVVLDRSGSMSSCFDGTVSGFNQFVQEQRELEGAGKARVTLVQFDDRYEVNFANEPIENVPDLDGESYVPRGATALNDAVARAIGEVGNSGWDGRVLFLIVTDGQENASREYGGPDGLRRITDLIRSHEDQRGWSFAFMGANIDSFATGASMGIAAGATMDFLSTNTGVGMAMASSSDATTTYRRTMASGQSGSAGFYGGKADASGTVKPRRKR